MSKNNSKKNTVPKRYIPSSLSRRDKSKQREMLKKSRKQYKKENILHVKKFILSKAKKALI